MDQQIYPQLSKLHEKLDELILITKNRKQKSKLTEIKGRLRALESSIIESEVEMPYSEQVRLLMVLMKLAVDLFI